MKKHYGHLGFHTFVWFSGQFADGRFDGVYNDVRSSSNPPYDFKRILNSKAYKAINSYSLPATNEVILQIDST